MAAAGYREIVLTGIEISSWGADLKNGLSLVDLIETVCAAAPGGGLVAFEGKSFVLPS